MKNYVNEIDYFEPIDVALSFCRSLLLSSFLDSM